MKPGDESRSHEPGDQPHRRRSERIPLEAIVHYRIEGSEFINLSSNISSHGIFIKNFSPPPVGTELAIKVQLPEEQGKVPMQLFGKVVRVVDGVGVEQRGMGVEFTEIRARSPDAIHYFVREIYEMTDIESIAVEEDDQKGGYRFSPGPQEILRLNPTPDGTGDSDRPARLRVLHSLLLVMVGVLLGGGFVLLFFLFR